MDENGQIISSQKYYDIYSININKKYCEYKYSVYTRGWYTSNYESEGKSRYIFSTKELKNFK